MKGYIRLIILIVAASMPVITYAGTPVRPAELPEQAQKFISRHFLGDEVREAEKEQGRRGLEYEVELRSGVEIDFHDNGDWKEVKASRGSSVPAAIIPKAISNYVAKNFKGQRVVEISRKRGGYEVELSNGTELHLTEDAAPMTGRGGRR